MLCGLIIWWRDSWFDFQLSLDIDICDVLFWGGRDFIMMLFFVTVQDTDKATIYIVSILMEVLRAVAQFEVPVSDRFLSVFCFCTSCTWRESISFFNLYLYQWLLCYFTYVCKQRILILNEETKKTIFVLFFGCFFFGGWGGNPLKSDRIVWNDEMMKFNGWYFTESHGSTSAVGCK